MLRPPKQMIEKGNGHTFATSSGGYRWYFLRKGDLSKEKADRRPAWAEDGRRHYFTCPFCFQINEAHTDGGSGHRSIPPNIELSFIYAGRDLDSFSCEVCRGCGQHMWITFEGAVPRRISGALKINRAKCPQCKKAVKATTVMDYVFEPSSMTKTSIYACCGMRWRETL